MNANDMKNITNKIRKSLSKDEEGTFRRSDTIARNGFLEVYAARDGRAIVVGYGGNMGCTMKDVKKRFEELYGRGTFDKVYALKQDASRGGKAAPFCYNGRGEPDWEGSPDYSWFIKVAPTKFSKAVDRNIRIVK